jgi:hypothetical protein
MTMHIPPPISTLDPVPVRTTQSATSIYTTLLPAQLTANSNPAPLTAANVGISGPTATTGSQPLGQIQNVPIELMRPLKKVKMVAAAVAGTGLTSKYGSAHGAR